MKKAEVIKRLDEICEKLEELEHDAEGHHASLRGLRNRLEELPTEADDIEEDTDD